MSVQEIQTNNITLSALRTQARAIVALTVLAMQREAGESRLGYLQTLVQPLIFIALYLSFHFFVHALSPPGMPALMFIALGVLPFRTFLWTYQAVARTPKIAKSLIMLPRVTTFDVIISQCLNEFCTSAILFVVVMSIVFIFSDSTPPYNIFGVLLAFCATWLLGCGFGLILLAAESAFPFVTNIRLLYSRTLLITSGVFFVVGQLPQSTWIYFTWNPVLHANEFMRSCWFPVYRSPVADAGFIAECILGLFFVGMILQRSVRRLAR